MKPNMFSERSKRAMEKMNELLTKYPSQGTDSQTEYTWPIFVTHNNKKMKPIQIKGNKVTPEEVENCIVHEAYIKTGKKITVRHLTLADGFEVVGTAGVVDPESYNPKIGNKVAREKALDRVWQHLGSILQNKLAAQ